MLPALVPLPSAAPRFLELPALGGRRTVFGFPTKAVNPPTPPIPVCACAWVRTEAKKLFTRALAASGEKLSDRILHVSASVLETSAYNTCLSCSVGPFSRKSSRTVWTVWLLPTKAFHPPPTQAAAVPWKPSVPAAAPPWRSAAIHLGVAADGQSPSGVPLAFSAS